MKEVVVSKPQNDSIISQMVSLYNTFKGHSFSEPLNFDISSIAWFCPLLVLPLSAHINCFGSKFNKNKDNSYLDVISFPLGVNSVSVFEQHTQINKNYIPISILEREKGPDRERLESLFSMMVYKVLGSTQGAQNAVHYPITELVTNIFDHSKQDKGFIFGQFYPNKNYLDICIVDCGRGLSKSYEEEKNTKLSDADSIIEVLRGHSTKPSIERGYGVHTSKRVVCECLGGDFVILSGSSALVSSRDKERIVDLPGFYWKGVIVSYRIPKPSGPVDISSYLE